MEVDPDYLGYAVDPQEAIQKERSRAIKENAREAVVEKIKSIIHDQFDKEIEMKENELVRINQRLTEARCVMDRLRACVVASFYAASFTKPVNGSKGPDPGAAYHPAIQNTLRKAATAVLSKNAPYKQQPKKVATATADKTQAEAQEEACSTENESSLLKSTPDQLDCTEDATVSSVPANASTIEEKQGTSLENAQGSARNLGGRQRIKKTVIVGNVSKYIPSDQREGSDRSTHKWMVYVRGSKEEPRIDNFVRKVWFFLHPSYRPNDLVEVCEAPFHLTRRGWGEFPIRVQIHFCDRRNRPVDIIHGLRLDRSYTGLQTLGAETVCEVELDRSSIRLNVDEILDVANLTNLPPESGAETQGKAADSERKEKIQDQNLEDDAIRPDVSATEVQENGEVLPTEGVKVSDQNCIEPVTNSKVSDQNCFEPVTNSKGSDQNCFEPVTTSCVISSDTVSPPRKRKLEEDGAASTVQPAEEQAHVNSDDSALEENRESAEEEDSAEKEDSPVPPTKRRKKRRRDSCKASTSEDEIMSESNTEESSVEADDRKNKDFQRESITVARTIDTCWKSTEEVAMENNDERIDPPDSEELCVNLKQDDKDQSSDAPIAAKQPVVVLSRSAMPGDNVFRMRSASYAEGVSNNPCASLIKSRVSVTPVLNVKLNPDPGYEAPTTLKNVTLTSDKHPENADPKCSASVTSVTAAPTHPPALQTVRLSAPLVKSTILGPGMPQLVKKDSSHPSHIRIPLSSLLKSAASLPQAQILKVSSQPSSKTKASSFSVNVVNLASHTAGLKQRQKRSLSDDSLSSRMLSVVTTQGAVAKSTPSVPVQLHIISPPGSSKKSGATITQQPITLQALQAPGTLTLGQDTSTNQSGSGQKKQIGQSQFVLAAVKGKQQQLTLIPTSSLSGGAKKLFTIVGPSPKGKKSSADSAVKQTIAQKVQGVKAGRTPSGIHLPSQPEVVATNKPVHQVIGDEIKLDGNPRSLVDDILPRVAKRVPLIDAKRDLTRFPFCARSESDFLDWNVGKQRASEWQRAALVQKVLRYIQERSETLKTCELPSKKFLMMWFLRHGYSVFTDEYDEEGSEDAENKKETKEEELDDIPRSMTSTKELLELLERKKEEKAKQGSCSTDENEDDVVFVDVVTVDLPVKSLPDVKQEPSDVSQETGPEDLDLKEQLMNAKIQQRMEAPEVAAIEDMTRKIGVNLHRTYGMPTCHLVLATALQQFAETLLRKSHSCALIKRDGGAIQRVAPEQIGVLDVAKAICETSAFDFFTDRNIGTDQ